VWRLQRGNEHEGEVGLVRLERRNVEQRFRALALRLWNFLERHLEGGERSFVGERLERARMKLAEMSEHVLRPDLDRAAAPGMEPGRRARHHLHRLRR